MTNFEIRLNIPRLMKDYSDSFLSEADKDTILLMIESFALYVKLVYIREVEEAVHSNRYKGKWEPIEEEGYREYLGTSPKGNILSIFKESLQIKKIGYDVIVRIDPNFMYPDSKLRFLRVLRAIEYGTSDFNARPVLTRVVKNLQSNMKKLWKSYLTMRGVS